MKADKEAEAKANPAPKKEPEQTKGAPEITDAKKAISNPQKEESKEPNV